MTVFGVCSAYAQYEIAQINPTSKNLFFVFNLTCLLIVNLCLLLAVCRHTGCGSGLPSSKAASSARVMRTNFSTNGNGSSALNKETFSELSASHRKTSARTLPDRKST